MLLLLFYRGRSIIYVTQCTRGVILTIYNRLCDLWVGGIDGLPAPLDPIESLQVVRNEAAFLSLALLGFLGDEGLFNLPLLLQEKGLPVFARLHSRQHKPLCQHSIIIH